ncbi:MAG TPA: VWA domain-containing protein [Thermoanaerobaculia bacterium]|nr:VWA domain-containing protein [Thermoanaerobaculia bacterium]
MHRLSRIVLVLSAVAVTALGQPSKLSETVNVHLVEVPVTVVDREGNPVRGLKQSDFEIYDQGKKRDITVFDPVDFASDASLKATSPLNPAARRSFLLLLDMSFSSPNGRAKAQEAARAFIAKTLTRRDLAAVATIDIEHGFRLLTSFTTDRNALVQAISNPKVFVSGDPLQLGALDVFTSVLPEENAATSRNSDRNDEALANIKDIARLEARLNDSYNRTRVERQMNLLSDMARTLQAVPGRKQVVFMSEGFDARLVQGRDARAVDEAKDEMEQTTSGEYWKVDFDARFGSSTTISLLDRMAHYFRGSDVVLHAIDIQGLRVQNDLQSGARINSNEGLYLLAHSTGGALFQNANDLGRDFDKMMRQQEVVYVLGFRASSNTPGKFHDLKVKVKGLPVGSTVSHRGGYYEGGGSANAIERTLTNAEVIMNDIPENDIHIATLVAALPGKSHGQVPVIVEINGADLARDAKTKDVKVDFYVYAFDEEGIVRDRVFQRITIDLAKTGEQLKKGGLKYYGTLSLPPGKYAVKALVRLPESEKKGFARADVSVPGVDDVAVLPPLFTDRPGQWLTVKGAVHGDSGTFPFQINGEPFMPSAVARLRNGEPRQFAVFVYNATADEMTWETTLTDPAGTRTTTPKLVRELQGDFVTKLVFQYDAAGVGPGNATLDIVIHKKGSADARRASVPLLVSN